MKWNHFLQWLINGLEKMKKDVIYEQLMGELEPKGIRLINDEKSREYHRKKNRASLYDEQGTVLAEI